MPYIVKKSWFISRWGRLKEGAGVLGLFLLLPCPGFPQQPIDTLLMDEVVVEDQSPGELGYKTYRIDHGELASNRFQNMGTMLQQETPIFVKTYGPSSTSTLSFRGTGARHTRVEWNGIDLTSPTLGLTDLSLLSASLVDEVGVVYGGGSLVDGSGGVGGSIRLNNVTDWQQPFQVSVAQQVGSFQDYRTVGEGSYGNSSVHGQTKAVYQTARNNFPYPNTARADTPVERLSHAQTRQLHLFQSGSYRVGDRHLLSLRGWYEKSDRNIPPTMTERISRAALQNDNLRLVGEWQCFFSPRGKLTARSGLLRYHTAYVDSLRNIESRHLSYSWQNELHLNYAFHPDWQVRGGLEYCYETARSDGFGSDQFYERPRTSVLASLIGNITHRLRTHLLLRQELLGDRLTPLLGTTGLEYRLGDPNPLYIRVHGSRNYNAPSLNDLFWSPGGNPKLKPEQSWQGSGELGYHHPPGIDSTDWTVSATGFYGDVRNWIQWRPTGEGYWEPVNYKRVLTRGVEGEVQLHYQEGPWSLRVSSRYSYVRSTNAAVASSNRSGLIGQQLVYTPVHTAQSSLQLRYQQFSIGYHHNYTGERFTSSLNDDLLPSYQLSHFRVGYDFRLGPVTFGTQLQIRNLWDRHYQVIANRPMPGRSIHLSLMIEYAKRSDS